MAGRHFDPIGAPASVGAPKAGGVVRVLHWSRRRRTLIAVAVVGALAVGLGPTAWVRATSAGREYSVADVPATPVGIVLGAGVRPDGTPSPFLQYRLDLAAQLFTAGKVRVLLVSGDNRTSHYDEPTAMQRYLVAKGIPAAKVVRDFAGRDTYDSCVRAVRVFGVRRATLVTQAYHLHRALAICRSVGLEAVGVGDRRAQAHRSSWAAGSWREYPANLKAAWDLISRRDPRILGAPEPGVRRALASSP